MKLRIMLIIVAALGSLLVLSPVSAQTTLNVATAGDQNMVDYVNNYLGPKFEKMNPGVKVRAVGTGPGDAGSQKIYEKLSAQQKAGNNAWDIDVAVIHQRGAATMVKESLLMPYRNDVAASLPEPMHFATVSLVTSTMYERPALISAALLSSTSKPIESNPLSANSTISGRPT